MAKATSICPFRSGVRSSESGSAMVCAHPGQEAFGPEFPAEDGKHLLLQVGGDHKAVLTHASGKLAGKKPRAAAEVEHPVAGLHVSYRKPVRVIEKAPEPGVEVPGVFCGEDLVVFVGFFVGVHWRSGWGWGEIWVAGVISSRRRCRTYAGSQRLPRDHNVDACSRP